LPRGRVISNPTTITLVLGGARSGKSRHAEQLLTQCPSPWSYIATAQAFDDEMRARIEEHRARRGEGWLTVEAPVDLAGALLLEPARPALVDCLTLWLTNLMLGGHDIAGAVASSEGALARRAAPTIVPDTPLGRSFRDEAGRLNQRIAAVADRVLFMVAGLPMTLK
jgi:adenosyl cobinamide kinase/adenosyl cobinamide phosphate guanylyltransferase